MLKALRERVHFFGCFDASLIDFSKIFTWPLGRVPRRSKIPLGPHFGLIFYNFCKILEQLWHDFH